MRDGDIDYSRYSLRELEEAFAGINAQQFPKNHANLRAAYERLKASLPTASQAETPVANDVATRRDEELDTLAFRGLRFLVLGAGAFFAYFNSLHRWVDTPDDHRTKGAWLEPFMPMLKPFLPRYRALSKLAANPRHLRRGQ